MKIKKEKSPVIDLNRKRDERKLQKKYPLLKGSSLDKATKIFYTYMPKKEIEKIVRYLQDTDPFVKDIAHEALTYITGRDFGKNPDQWLKWWRISKQNFSI